MTCWRNVKKRIIIHFLLYYLFKSLPDHLHPNLISHRSLTPQSLAPWLLYTQRSLSNHYLPPITCSLITRLLPRYSIYLFQMFFLFRIFQMFATIVDTDILKCLLGVVILIEIISIIHQLMLAATTTLVLSACFWCFLCRHHIFWLHRDQGWHFWCYHCCWCPLGWLWNFQRQGWSFNI